MEPLTQKCLITQAITLANGGAGVTNIVGETIDMTGFEMITFIAAFGPIVGGAQCSIKAQRGSLANMSDAADIEGTGQTVADTDDGKVFVLDVIHPGKPYIRLLCNRATQNITVAALAILSGARNRPVTQPAQVIVELHKDKAEGTA
jgi:hypothetical protein